MTPLPGRLIAGLAALAGAACLVAAGQPATAAGAPGTLRVEITNVRNAKGVVRIDLCQESEFLKKCAIFTDVKAASGTVVATIGNVPAGTYAISATHDENMNQKVDRGLFGLPKEGVGFSNDAPIRMGPPRWTDARFAIAGAKAISLKMRYFIGPSGPR